MATKSVNRREVAPTANRPSIIELAVEGGDVAETLLRRFTRSLVAEAPDMGVRLRDEIKAARRAARKRDVDGSLHRTAALAEGVLNSGSPGLAAVICGVGANLASTMPEDEIDVISGRANLQNVAGLIAMRLGRYPEATQCFETTRSLALAADDKSLLAASLLNLANTSRASGSGGDARDLARNALSLYEAAGDKRGQIQLLQTLGSIAIEDGTVEAAEDWVDRAASLLRSARDAGLTSGNHHLRGRIHVYRGDLDAAEHSMHLAVAAARRANDSDKLAAAMQSWSAVASDSDRPTVARGRMISAVALAEEAHLPWRLQVMLPSLVRMHFECGAGHAGADCG